MRVTQLLGVTQDVLSFNSHYADCSFYSNYPFTTPLTYYIGCSPLGAVAMPLLAKVVHQAHFSQLVFALQFYTLCLPVAFLLGYFSLELSTTMICYSLLS